MTKKIETRVFLDPELDRLIASQAAIAGLTKPKYIAQILAGLEPTTAPDPQLSTKLSIKSDDLDSELSDIKARLTTLEQSAIADTDLNTEFYDGQIVDGQMGKLYNRLVHGYEARNQALGNKYYANNTLGIVYRLIKI